MRDFIRNMLQQYDVGDLLDYQTVQAGRTASTWKVFTTQGHWIVRTLKSAAQGELEYQITHHVLQQAAIVPRILSTRAHEPVLSLDGQFVNLQEAYEHTPFPTGEAAAIYQLGKTVGQLHRCLQDFRTSFDQPDRFDLLDLWLQAKPLWPHVADCLGAGVENKWLDMDTWVEETYALTDRWDTPHLIHGDLGTWNVLFSPNGIRVIDFGEGRRGNTYFDLAAALTSAIGWGRDASTTRQLTEIFLTAYAGEMGSMNRRTLHTAIRLWLLRGALASLADQTAPLETAVQRCCRFLAALDPFQFLEQMDGDK